MLIHTDEPRLKRHNHHMFVAFLGVFSTTQPGHCRPFPQTFLKGAAETVEAILDVKLPKKTSIWELQKRISVPLISGDSEMFEPQKVIDWAPGYCVV